jgi:hypothetical protein
MTRKKEYKIHSNERLNAELEFLKGRLGMHSKAQVISECIEPLFEIISHSIIPMRLAIASANNCVMLSANPIKFQVCSGKLTASLDETVFPKYKRKRGVHND